MLRDVKQDVGTINLAVKTRKQQITSCFGDRSRGRHRKDQILKSPAQSKTNRFRCASADNEGEGIDQYT